jgi:pimeloyl-ACP methyl ester carboxylesterase
MRHSTTPEHVPIRRERNMAPDAADRRVSVMNVATGWSGLRHDVVKLGEVELELFEGGSGQPLLFLHGGNGPRPDAPFLASLCEEFRVIAPTHPGFGASSLPFWLDSIDDFAHIHLELINRLGLSDVVLVGHSIGGWTAAELATKTTSSIDRVVLIAPVGIKVGPVDRLDIPDIFAMPQQELQRLLYVEPEKWQLDPAKLSDHELLAIARNRQTLALITWEPYMHNPKLKHRLHRVDRPTLLVRGALDGLVSHEYAAAYAGLIPGARLETVAAAAHSPHLEQPERFVEIVRRFAGR